ncbi:hypothetical protein FQR65_LT06864 [Abscondita terminalis]|nr:hypothetical protein FQR65_LT06864 [Abscondita terminalis]
MDDSTSEIFNTKRKRFKKWWEQLSYLEQKLIISLVITGSMLFLVVLILIIKAATSPKICNTANCIIAAAEVVSHTNPTINPCHDFYQFTCQKLNEPSSKNMQLTTEQVEEQLINLLIAPVHDDDHSQLKSQKKLFAMCLNKSEGDNSFNAMKTIFDELHGWPAILGYDWKAGSFEWTNTIIQLKQRGLPFNMLMTVEFVPDNDMKKRILYIGKPRISKIEHNNRHEYRKLMSEVAVAFGAERSRAGSDMKRVLDFMVQLEKLTVMAHSNKKLKISEIQNHFTEINWLNFINGILKPNSAILPEDYVLAPSHKFMQELLDLINRTPKRIQANYIIWTVVEKYLPFLSEHIKHLHSNYAHLIDSVTVAPERWHMEQCNYIVGNSFLTPPSEIMYAKHYLGQEKIDEVLQLGKNLQKAFEMFLKENTWFDENTRIKALVKIQNLRIIGGLHLDLKDEQSVVLNQSQSFLINLLENCKNKYESIYKQSHEDETDFPTLSLPIYTTDVLYLEESNVLYLPVAAYLEDSPVYLNYGEMGAVISQKLVREIIPKGDLFWSNNAFDSFGCILRKNDTANIDNLLDVIGILLSHAAYQLWTYEHNEEQKIIGLHYTPNQLFWISSFIGYCTRHNHHNGLVNIITQAHPNFAEDFECPWGSPMNPLEKYCKDRNCTSFVQNVKQLSVRIMSERNNQKGVVTCLWRQKSLLERNLIIALLIILLLFIGLLLYVVIKPSVIKKKCASPACLTAAAQIMNRLNTEEDPCQNFFKFACGNYPIAAKTPMDIIGENLEKHITDIVTESINDNDHYLLKLQKNLYQTCLNQTVSEQDALEVINRTINEIGWPVVSGFQWREETFDWQQLIFKLRRKGYPFQMMLNVDVIPENGTYITEVAFPRIAVVTESTSLYKKYMTSVAIMFGAEANRAEIEMEKVFDFMQNIDKIVDDNYGIIFTVREFQEENGDIDWLNFLNNLLYPVKQLSLDDSVKFPTPNFTAEFFTLLYRTPKRIISNYILWSVVENVIEYMPEKIRSLKKNYECQVNTFQEIKRDKFCKKCLAIPSDIMLVRKYLPKTKQAKIKEIVKNVKNQFKTLLTKSRWLDDASKTSNLEKFDNILDVIGAPYDYFDESYWEQFTWPGQYNKTTKYENFFDKLLDTIHAHQNNIFYKIHKKEDRNSIDLVYTLTTDVNANFCPEFLSVGILQDIFYDENRPMYLNYGSIGTVVGHELTHGFGKWGSGYGKYGYPEETWSNFTKNAYAKETECMVQDAKSFDAKKTLSNDTLEENLADYTGIRTAYSAYQAWVQENGEERMLTGVPYTQNQLFWIASISHQCFIKLTKKDYHADGAFRTIAPLRNTYEFAKDFNCPADVPMNPSKKCQVF